MPRTSVLARRGPTLDEQWRDRLVRSAQTLSGPVGSLADFHAWFAERGRATSFAVERVPLAAMAGWRIDPQTGNLGHDSGRFFTVEGLAVTTNFGATPEWAQPIICQPEVGILGILAKEINGVLHFLMQAKMEPGNVNMLQLSPTVQATRSNYTRVHGGAKTAYLEYFDRRAGGAVLADVVQSEQGAWFLAKRNRNVIIEVAGEVPDGPDHYWLTLGQIWALLRLDNLVNMDARTVLSCLPPMGPADDEPLHPISDLLSWFAEAKMRYDVRQRLQALNRIPDWHRSQDSVARADGRFFEVVGVSVRASSREVVSWSQPLVAPRETGVVTFLTRRFSGVRHVLVRARVEAGYRDVVELAPTVQCAPGNYLAGDDQPPFLDEALDPPADRVLFSTVLSEEGGRFYHAQNVYQLVAASDRVPSVEGDDFRWVTVPQLAQLVRYSYYLNIQARSLLACLHGQG